MLRSPKTLAKWHLRLRVAQGKQVTSKYGYLWGYWKTYTEVQVPLVARCNVAETHCRLWLRHEVLEPSYWRHRACLQTAIWTKKLLIGLLGLFVEVPR
jgi:hypothetical protein